MDVIHHLTLKVAMVRGLVGDGVEDLVDFGVEIWLLETPFTMWRKTGKRHARARVIMMVSTIVILCGLYSIHKSMYVDKTACQLLILFKGALR